MSGANPIDLYVDGGDPTAIEHGDTLLLLGTTDLSDTFIVRPGFSGDAGSGVVNGDVTDFAGIESILLDAQTPTAPAPAPLQGQSQVIAFVQAQNSNVGDVVIIEGTSGDNDVNVTSLGPDQLQINVDGRAPITTMHIADESNLVVNTGDGDDNVTLTPTGADHFSFEVNAGDRNDQDTVNVQGSSQDDSFAYQPDSQNATSADITVNQRSVRVNGADAIVLDGGDGQDQLEAAGGDRDDDVVVTPMGQSSGEVQFNDSSPLMFKRLDDVTLDAGGGENNITVNAGNDDDVDITSETIGVNGQNIDIRNQDQVLVSNTDGDGTVTPPENVNYQGRGQDIVVDLVSRTVTEQGQAPLSFDQALTLDVDAAQRLITVLGTDSNDSFSVSPTGSDAATLSINGIGTAITFTNTGEINVDGADGNDRLILIGTSADESIEVDRTDASLVIDGRVEVLAPNVETLSVQAESGDDTVTIIGSGDQLVEVDAGNEGNDTLVVNGAVDASHTFAYQPGALGHQGQVTLNGDVSSFIEFEAVTLNAGGATGADTFTIAASDADDTVSLTSVDVDTLEIIVNDRLPVTVDGASPDSQVSLDLRTGNDQVTAATSDSTHIDLNISADDVTNDALTLIATNGTDQVAFTAHAADASSGSVTINEQTAAFTGIDQLSVDGRGENDTLEVTGYAGADLITVTSNGNADGSANVNGLGSIDWLAIEDLTLNGGADTDNISIALPNSSNPIQVNGSAVTTDDLSIRLVDSEALTLQLQNS